MNNDMLKDAVKDNEINTSNIIKDHPFQFSIRIVVIEHIATSPGPLDISNNDIDSGASFELVPVLRVFGTTSDGKTACVHLHQIYPYFFIPYDGDREENAVSNYISILTQSINTALTLNVALHQSKTSYVAGMSLVKGLPFYGYHDTPRFFLKIYLTEPTLLNKVADLCSSGAIMHTVLQPYEAHIPYVSQFLLDFRLYGMGWLHLNHCVWRKNRHGDLPINVELSQSLHLIQETYSELEVDATGFDIHIAPFTRAVQSLEIYWNEESKRRDKLGLPSLPISKCHFEKSVESPSNQDLFLSPHEHSFPSTYSKNVKFSQSKTHSDQNTEIFPEMTQSLLAWMFEHQNVNDDTCSTHSSEVFPEDHENGSSSSFEFELGKINIDPLFTVPQLDGSFDMHPKQSGKIEVYVDVPPVSRSRSITPKQNSNETLDSNLFKPSTSLPEKVVSSEVKKIKSMESSVNHSERISPSNSMSTDSFTPTSLRRVSKTKLLPVVEIKVSPITQKKAQLTNSTTVLANPIETPFSVKQKKKRSKRETESFSALKRFQDFKKYTKYITDTRHDLTLSHPVRSPRKRTLGMTTRRNVRLNKTTPPRQPMLPFPPEKTQTCSSPTSGFIKELEATNSPAKFESNIDSTSVVLLKRPEPPLFHHFPAKEGHSVSITSDKVEYNDDGPSISNSVPSPPFDIPDTPTSTIFESVSPSLTKPFKPSACYLYSPFPPSFNEIETQLLQLKLPLQIHPVPYYSDSPAINEYTDFHECLYDQLRLPPPLFAPSTQSAFEARPITAWSYYPPPTITQAIHSLSHAPVPETADRSQIDFAFDQKFSFEPTPRNEVTSSAEKSHFKYLIVEIHATSDNRLLPNPQTDEIQFIAYGFVCDAGVMGTDEVFKRGLLVNNAKDKVHLYRKSSSIYLSEFDMLLGLINLVRSENPDALIGYNLRSFSWGYIFERALRIYALDLNDALSRVIESGLNNEEPQMMYRKATSFKPTGRLVINAWRWFQEELPATDYTIEKMCQLILKRRIPRFPFHVLTAWWETHPHRVVEYYLSRVAICWELLYTCDFVHRTSEFARTYGMDFQSVLTRGSQFRVESTLLRITRQLQFVLISPSRAQVESQRAAECIPLVMEPESAFYPDPVIVLDFQALYPSIMIAYNICYSTCIGKSPKLGSKLQKLGFTQYSCPTNFRDEDLFSASNGVMFVKPHVRKSILAAMLTELLETRLMVKQSMKLYKSDKILTKVLDTRQLCLKLLSNVTYGYTAASFSGRMPLVEIGDAIVSTGRSILESAIQMISQHPTWKARVVYGDTDSLFVQVKSATKERAFQIGREIAEAVTKANPPPIKLNFEKVYMPCVLITKKRYIGYKFENENDTTPTFDAKGIETVRRDGCPAVAKILRRSLEILFDTRDLSELKSYIQCQFIKILEHRVSPKDFIIAKEVKLGSYSDRTLPPPGALLSMKRMEIDPRAEPAMRERVPYLIIYGAPGDRLIDQVMLVDDFLEQPNLFLNGQYYILHLIIPALQRIFDLLSVDIHAWYNEVKKPMKLVQYSSSQKVLTKKATIDQYYNHCICGGKVLSDNFCHDCLMDPLRRTGNFLMQFKLAEKRYQQLSAICFDCMQFQDREIECDSLSCEILFDRIKSRRRLRQLWSQSETLF